MKILSFLNVSNPTNPLGDSGFVFQRLVLEELERMGHRAWLVAPAETTPLTSVEVLPLHAPETKYHARFDFDWKSVAAATRNVWREVDVILVNQPEIAPNLAAMSTVLSGRRVPIASYIHYLPLDGEGPDGVVLDASLDDGGLGRWVIGAIRTAVESSQTTMIGSAFGAGLLQRWIGQPRLLTIIPPPVEPSLEQLAGVRPAPGPLRLLYNHRLYAHYGTERLFAWIDRAYERAGARLEVWVSDPTRSRSDTRRQLDAASERTRARIEERPYVRLTAATTREQYHQLLGATHACLAPLRNAALWSMSLCDALAAGRPVLAPRRGAYDEILELASSDPYDGPEELVARILDWVERPPEPQAELAARMQRCLGPGAIAERFANALESIRLAW